MQTQTHQLFASIRVTVVKKDNLLGFATVKVCDAIFLTGLRILDGKKGIYVSMPAKKEPNGEYKDIFFPASKDVRDQMQAAILDVYHEMLKKIESANA